MLIVETYLKEVAGKGIGLFSKNHIPKGHTWWVRNIEFDRVLSDIELKKYNSLTQSFIKTYGFLEPSGNWYLCIDNAKFTNHSIFPNSKNEINETGDILSSFALLDIYADEEITCDYKETCQDCIVSLGFDDIENHTL